MRKIFIKFLPKHIKDYYINNVDDKGINSKINSIIIFVILMFLFSVAFIFLTDKMSDNEMVSIDDFITNHIIFYRSAHLNIIMKYITFVGDLFGYLILCIILGLFFYFKKNWRVSLEITLVLVLASGLNVFLKNVISRPRPLINRIVYANFYSFPSGHAMSAIVFYGFISYLCLILLKKLWQKVMIVLFCVVMIFAIGISRIYLGVHYPSDILAGYLAGTAWLMFCLVILNVLTLRKTRLNSYE
ncbi:hypothetical protein A5893_14980 [Pedobacter psychrophilus]|uniref:Phosphatidic acid phosphatase type 2/haloperoxidase domain-containing protein n=1 Tax=Pedobacter psychrophilus TaxID=1826909 RepID=A0A179DAN1_9SPHI|nr:phosphatase PAP2 family protein [Pedobacter psychrophilus]OAQ38106.1 hypothetical protein A5893_14980 [Pedobacter psychrophilus]